MKMPAESIHDEDGLRPRSGDRAGVKYQGV